MIAGAISAELLKLRRSWLIVVTVLISAVGPALTGAATWSAMALERTDLSLPLPAFDVTWSGFLGGGVGYSSLFVLVGATLATAYLFGSEFQNDTIEVTLSGTVRAEELVVARAIVLAGWTVVLTVLVFGLSIVVGFIIGLGGVGADELGRGLVLQMTRTAEIYAGLPLIAWIAIRSRGMLSPVAFGVLAGSAALLLRVTPLPLPVPWSMAAILSDPTGLWSTLVIPVAVFSVGSVMCLIDMRRRDVI